MIAVYAWNKRKSMCALHECSTGKLLTHWLNTLTRVCLCWTASVAHRCVALETLIFLQNACWTVNAISYLDSPVCQVGSGCSEITLVTHGYYEPWLKWKSQMCKDQLRKKSSMPAFRNAFMPVDILPVKVLGICPNCLCRNCFTANRQYCVIAIIGYTWGTASLLQSLFRYLCREMWEEWTKYLDLGEITTWICNFSATLSYFI